MVEVSRSLQMDACFGDQDMNFVNVDEDAY